MTCTHHQGKMVFWSCVHPKTTLEGIWEWRDKFPVKELQ